MKKIKTINREAEGLLKEKKFDEARKKINEGLEVDSENVDLLTTSGKIHLESGDELSALEDFNKALKKQQSSGFIIVMD